MNPVLPHPASVTLHRPLRAGVLVLAALWGCGDEPPPVDDAPSAPTDQVVLDEVQRENAGIRTTPVRMGQVADWHAFPATLAPPDTAIDEVGSLVEGRVERVRVLEGQAVRAGQALAYIHAHELTEALGDLAAAESHHDWARNALARSRRLLESGAVPREEVERREAEAAAARSELERARILVDHLDPSPDGDVTVRSGRAGVVLAVHTHPAQAVTPGTPLFTVGAEEILWATVRVPERDAASLQPGGAARIHFDALPGTTVEGRVVSVGRRVDPATRSVTVQVELDRVPPGIRTGMYVSVELQQAGTFSGLEVPAGSVQRLDGRDVVFVAVEDLRYRPVPVTANLVGDDRMMVQGLQEGDRVVVSGAYVLKAMLEQGAGEGA